MEKVYKTSEKRRAEGKQRYYYLKSHGICTKCGQEDAAKGKTLCLNCLDKVSVRNLRYYSHHKEQIKKATKAYKERMKAEHRCVSCGADLGESAKTRCKKCLMKINRWCKLHRKRCKYTAEERRLIYCENLKKARAVGDTPARRAVRENVKKSSIRGIFRLMKAKML